MIKAVIFDFDEMILKAEIFSVQYSREFGVPIDDMLPFFKGVFKECLVGKTDTLEALEPFLEKWRWKGTAQELLNWWCEHEEVYNTELIDFIKELKAKGIRCFLATNQEKYKVEYFREKLQFFDKIFASGTVGAMKQSDRFYEEILKELENEGIKPEETIQWDDEPEVLAKAKEKGIQAYEYKNNEDFKKKMSELI